MKLLFVMCVITIAQCSGINDAEFLTTSHDDVDRMLVWPPHIIKKNRTEFDEGEVSTDTPAISRADEIIHESKGNSTQSLTKTSSGKENRMTNWVSNLPKEINRTVDVSSIQLTTSQPQVVPLLETVATFRNSGSWTNGNKSYNVEVEVVRTNVTQDSTNQSSEETNSKPNQESSSVTPDVVTTMETENNDVKIVSVLDSLEHNTEIYGKTAAEELAELSVIDILLRKRSVPSLTKRSQPEFDDSDESKDSEENSEESDKPQSVPNPNSGHVNTSNELHHNSNDSTSLFFESHKQNSTQNSNLTLSNGNTTESTYSNKPNQSLSNSHLLVPSPHKEQEIDGESLTTLGEQYSEHTEATNTQVGSGQTRHQDETTQSPVNIESHNSSETKSDKKPIFAGFKSIADYIGFAL